MHKLNHIRQVAPVCPCGRTRCRHLSNNIEPSVYGRTAAMRLMANYFDQLLSLDTPTCTVAHIAKRFKPSTVLWAFHTIQPSSLLCSHKQCTICVNASRNLVASVYVRSGSAAPRH